MHGGSVFTQALKKKGLGGKNHCKTQGNHTGIAEFTEKEGGGEKETKCNSLTLSIKEDEPEGLWKKSIDSTTERGKE